jgi:hypothetical protein
MLYVDFFWTWGIGAMFAVAAARQLKQEKDIWVNKYFIQLVLFMAIDFGATGTVLLWTNPAWETMQVYWMLEDIPLWFVLLWLVSNVVLPIISYGWSFKLIKQGKTYQAMLVSLAGYVLFFFMLFYGWDGTGYQRFFYDATGTLLEPNPLRIPWVEGTSLGLAWFGSHIAITLYILAIFFLIPHFYFCCKWAVDGARQDAEITSKVPSKDFKARFMIAIGALLFVGVGCLMALGSGLIGWLCIGIGGKSVAILGFLIGIPVISVVTYFLLLKPGKIFPKLFDKFFNFS